MHWYEEIPYNHSTVYMNNIIHVLNYGHTNHSESRQIFFLSLSRCRLYTAERRMNHITHIPC